MIHHLFTIHADGWPVEEHLAADTGSALYAYACGIGVCLTTDDANAAQLTCATWKDGKWDGYYRASIGAALNFVQHVPTPACFEPLPCPKPTPAVTAPAFASCAKDGQEVAFMALERRIRELGAEAEDYRGAGNDAMADILTGHQSACVAALRTLREVAR